MRSFRYKTHGILPLTQYEILNFFPWPVMPRQVTPRKEEIKKIEDVVRARCDRYMPRSRWPEKPHCKSGHPTKLIMVYGFKQPNTIPNAGRVARIVSIIHLVGIILIVFLVL